MAYEYLNHLAASDEEKAKLVTLAARSPAALVGMMQAAPEAFSNYLGEERARHIKRQLEELLGEDERRLLDADPGRPYLTGAIIGRESPPLKPPRYDIEQRDLLFDELMRLRQQGGEGAKQRISVLENRLNAMLDNA